jgi:GTPase
VIQADDDDPARTHDGATHAVPDRPAIELTKRRGFSAADRAALRAKHPDAILLSAKSPEDVAALRETIIAFLEAAMAAELRER